MTRSELNKRIGYLAHGLLKLDNDIYFQLTINVDAKCKGHASNMDDEHADLFRQVLEKMAEKRTSTHEVKKHERQENFIPVLMELLGWNWTQVSSFMRKIVKKHHTSKCSAAELSKVIRGMVAIIDKNILEGKIVLTGKRKFLYDKYTHNHRQVNVEH